MPYFTTISQSHWCKEFPDGGTRNRIKCILTAGMFFRGWGWFRSMTLLCWFWVKVLQIWRRLLIYWFPKDIRLLLWKSLLLILFLSFTGSGCHFRSHTLRQQKWNRFSWRGQQSTTLLPAADLHSTTRIQICQILNTDTWKPKKHDQIREQLDAQTASRIGLLDINATKAPDVYSLNLSSRIVMNLWL